MANLYDVLGVKKDASAEEIRKAYRRLAKESHPDLHPGDKAAEQRFRDVNAAYEILKHKNKRAQYDRGEIDEKGAERPRQTYYRDFADAGPGFKYSTHSDYADLGDLGGIFSDLFGRQGGGPVKARGPDVSYQLTVDFLEAARGARKRVRMADGKQLDITIPAGLEDGQVLRLRGKGMAGLGGGPAGDALVHVHVAPHPSFRRDGADIRSDLPVTLGEATGGARIKVETVTGPVTLSVPKGANSGTVLRLKGKGLPGGPDGKPGDHYVELKVVLPDPPDAELSAFVAEWEARHPYDPRNGRKAAS